MNRNIHSRSIYFCFFLLLLFSALIPQNLVKEKIPVEVGIASIEENNDNVIINIYAINDVPIAGVQFEIEPNDIFSIDSIAGGRCTDLGFQLHSNNKGVLLGFSMTGKEISKSINKNINDNILFSAYGKKNKDFYNQKINLKTTLAARAGKKINVKVNEYFHSQSIKK